MNVNKGYAPLEMLLINQGRKMGHTNAFYKSTGRKLRRKYKKHEGFSAFKEIQSLG